MKLKEIGWQNKNCCRETTDKQAYGKKSKSRKAHFENEYVCNKTCGTQELIGKSKDFNVIFTEEEINM